MLRPCRGRGWRSRASGAADIGVGPAVEPALLHRDQKVGRQIVAEAVALPSQLGSITSRARISGTGRWRSLELWVPPRTAGPRGPFRDRGSDVQLTERPDYASTPYSATWGCSVDRNSPLERAPRAQKGDSAVTTWDMRICSWSWLDRQRRDCHRRGRRLPCITARTTTSRACSRK